ncbi:hypothetical protein Hamer_G014521 [Homarus americanus]|uniref:Uncharacterized protein n=1 Tax=Homarus americanus TaxID=6706 RepID=A0A8J5T7K5_HOMAM|nr:hypothetical protein Hamer_G014521 [Homarus americanus]
MGQPVLRTTNIWPQQILTPPPLLETKDPDEGGGVWAYCLSFLLPYSVLPHLTPLTNGICCLLVLEFC